MWFISQEANEQSVIWLLLDDAELFTEKEICFEEIQSAYLQLPAHTFSSEKSSVMEAVEFHAVTVIRFYHMPSIFF